MCDDSVLMLCLVNRRTNVSSDVGMAFRLGGQTSKRGKCSLVYPGRLRVV